MKEINLYFCTPFKGNGCVAQLNIVVFRFEEREPEKQDPDEERYRESTIRRRIRLNKKMAA
jgi:hypothetical protein